MILAPLLINRNAISICPFLAAKSSGLLPYALYASNNIVDNDQINIDNDDMS